MPTPSTPLDGMRSFMLPLQLNGTLLHEQLFFFRFYPTRPVPELVFLPQPLHLSQPQCGHDFFEPLVDIIQHGLRHDPYNGPP